MPFFQMTIFFEVSQWRSKKEVACFQERIRGLLQFDRETVKMYNGTLALTDFYPAEQLNYGRSESRRQELPD